MSSYVLSKARQAAGRVLRFARHRATRTRKLPRTIRVTEFEPKGCLFEVATPIEEGRVLSLGGEPEFIRLLLDEVGPGCCLFDLGSCVGLYALHAALRGADVVAFEPDPGYRSRLERNILLNRLTNSVMVIGWAVSDKKGTVSLYTDGVEGNSPSLALVGDRGSVLVDTNSIDDAMARQMLRTPDVIKIDIEGAEILALRGMAGLLRSSQAPRLLFVELHPAFLSGFNSSIAECVELIESSGYTRTYWQPRADQVHCVYQRSGRDEAPGAIRGSLTTGIGQGQAE